VPGGSAVGEQDQAADPDAGLAGLGLGGRGQGAGSGRGVSERLDRKPPCPNNGPAIMPAVHIVEYPDPEGRRWQRALELLLEAGRAARRAEPAA
jgi:hypothetical protein